MPVGASVLGVMSLSFLVPQIAFSRATILFGYAAAAGPAAHPYIMRGPHVMRKISTLRDLAIGVLSRA